MRKAGDDRQDTRGETVGTRRSVKGTGRKEIRKKERKKVRNVERDRDLRACPEFKKKNKKNLEQEVSRV